MSDQSLSGRALASCQESVASDRTEMLLADVKIHAAIERFLNHTEIHLVEAEVSTVSSNSYKKASTGEQARSGTSVVLLVTNKNLDPLFETLEKNGEAPLNSDMVARLLLLLADEDKPRPKLPAKPLTPRQLDVVKLLAQGKTNQEIAQELVLSAGTVRTHVQRILARLGAPDRTCAVVRAIELGLITPKSGT